MSDLEFEFLGQIGMFRLPAAVTEFKFNPTRRWRFDFAWPDKKVALEIEGGIWVNGAHNRGAHFTSDCEKYNAATLSGWQVYRVTAKHIKDLTAVDMIKTALS